ncbi:MAG: hypothetical protein GY830_07135 [Bacteroidetes bacterium]|nr:hypothetical protein [Bacteroidota bacterium]
MSKPIKLEIKKSDHSGKKYMAIFTMENGQTKIIHFGAKGYEDYTMHKDEKRKKLYINRHEQNENWHDPMTPGALSRFILWNKTSLQDSISDFKSRFNLK